MTKQSNPDDTLSGVVFHAMETGELIRDTIVLADGFLPKSMYDPYLYKMVGDKEKRFKRLGNGHCFYSPPEGIRIEKKPAVKVRQPPMGEYL